VKLPLVFVEFWYGTLPVHTTGAKPFQSMQPTLSIARFPSASSKPDLSAIDPAPPQPVAAAGSTLESMTLNPKLPGHDGGVVRGFTRERAALGPLETCRRACASWWVERMAVRAESASPERCCVSELAEAAPTASSERTAMSVNRPNLR
jgi:hypothetical protein